MSQEIQPHRKFLGTYFDSNLVLRLSRWLIILGWFIMAAYLLEYGYGTYQAVSGAIINAYPIDYTFLVLNLKTPLQGGMLLAILYSISQVLLMLLDIEDNTRASRPRGPGA
jgi:uncharacterized membrane protein YjjP (DUF1212 family)